MRRGIVLIWALVGVAVVTTIVGSLCSYYTTVGRIARGYQDQTGSKFAAWRGLDEKFHRYLAQLSESSQAADIADALFSSSSKTYTDTQGNSFKATFKVTKDGKTITEEDVAKSLNKLASGEKLALEVTVTAKQTTGGLPMTTKLREVIEIEKKTAASGGLETMQAFNYVYFANNYGHLDGSVVANGEIGGNDKFTIDGSRVNGFVKVRGAYSNDTSAVVLQNTPKMWPYYSYMKRVVENQGADLAVSVPGYSTAGVDFYTQVRPTNPVIISSTSNIVWQGGYEPPGVSSQYGEVNSSGQITSVQKNPFEEEVLKYLDGNPYATEYANYYDGSNPKENPQQNEFNTYCNADGSAKDHPTLQTKYNEYYNADGTAKANPVASEAGFGDYLNADGSKKTYPNQSQIDSLKSEWSSYFTSEANYNSGTAIKPAKCPTEWRKKGVWYGIIYCASDGSKRTSYNNYVSDKTSWTSTQTDFKTRYDSWNTAKSTFDSTEKGVYLQWTSERDDWISSDPGLAQYRAWNKRQTEVGSNYTKWESDKADATRKFTAWQQQFETWYNNMMSGIEEVDLTWKTTCNSVSNGVSMSTPVINVTTNVIEVPNMSDGTKMQDIIDYCKTNVIEKSGRVGGWLDCWNVYKDDSDVNHDLTITNVVKKRFRYYRTTLDPPPETPEEYYYLYPVLEDRLVRTIARVTVNGGDGSTVAPFKNEDAALSGVQKLMLGSAILVGTEDYPINIDGPVYFPGDVVIRGFVKGQGTIYAGRNIHIIGDISYVDPPNWPHSNLNDPKNHPETTWKRNRECDLLMLVARGCIVVGDYTSGTWQSDANMQYLKKYGASSSACNDFCESDIGYSKGFSRDYTQNDGGEKVTMRNEVSTHTGTAWMKAWMKEVFTGKWYQIDGLYAFAKEDTTLVVETTARKYYETLFGDAVISGFKQVASPDPAEGWKHSSSLLRRIICVLKGKPVTTSDVTANPAAGDITEIDAALVANHGIFGVVGGDGMPQFTLNGAMICRDEGLLPSFTSRFSSYTKRKIWLNWDMRLRSSSAEGVLYGALMKYVENTTVPQFVITVKSQSIIR